MTLSREEIQASQAYVRRILRRMDQWRPPSIGRGAELAHLQLPPRRGRSLRFVARTEAPTRSRTRVDMAGVSLAAYERNPLVLFNHDETRLPIGRGEAFIRDRELLVDITFDRRDRFARRIESKYRRQYLHAVSTSFDVFDYAMDDCGASVVTDSELLEVSVVVMPDDRWSVRKADE